jgi:hypothetical protein
MKDMPYIVYMLTFSSEKVAKDVKMSVVRS